MPPPRPGRRRRNFLRFHPKAMLIAHEVAAAATTTALDVATVVGLGTAEVTCTPQPTLPSAQPRLWAVAPVRHLRLKAQA